MIQRITIILVSCIVAAASVPSTQARDSGGLEPIKKWDFGKADDAKGDDWPDGWTRRRELKYPGFIPIKIAKRTLNQNEMADAEQFRRGLAQIVVAAEKGKLPWDVIPESVPPSIDKVLEQTLINPYLSVEMDGGAAEVFSPLLPVENHSLYGMEVDIKSNSGDFEAFGRLLFLDRDKNELFDTRTKSVSTPQDWQRNLRTSMIYEDDPRVAFVRVALTVLPKKSNAFRGSFGFDNVQVMQMPKIRLSLDRPSRLYHEGERVLLNCDASGMQHENMRIDLQLIDHNGEIIDQITKALDRADNTKQSLIYNNTNGSSPRSRKLEAAYWHGECEWGPPTIKAGYYELRTQLAFRSRVFFERSEHFVVLPRMASSGFDPRFGWTLDENVFQWKSDRILELTKEGRTGRIKLPVWFDGSDLASQDRTCQLIDRLQSTGVSCVGIIDKPPELVSKRGATRSLYQQSAPLEDPSYWQPLLEPVLRHICIRMTEFQIGNDSDVQYAFNPRFANSIETLRKMLTRYGPESTIVAAKNPWIYLATAKNFDRWQQTNDLEPAETELKFLPKIEEDRTTRLPQWTSITPISAYRYSLATRVRDLTARIVAATANPPDQTTTAWISSPFADSVGFLSTDGGPREMFLPYRTVVDAVYKKRYSGRIEMPGGCDNALLVSESQSILILWSSRSSAEHPSTEQMYLGENVRAQDVWGQEVKVEQVETPFGAEQKITIGKWPVIVYDVDPQVAMWRMGVSFAQDRIDSLMGQRQEVLVNFANPFPTSVSGRIDLVAPEIFQDEVESTTFDVAPSSTERIPISVMLGRDTSAQESVITIVVNTNGDPPRRFAVRKPLKIGNDEVAIEAHYRIDDANQLWLDVEAINNTSNPVGFDCLLMVPNRVHERFQLTKIRERQTSTIVLPNASDMFGQTLWLRCDQFGTKRVLNYRIRIDNPADSIGIP